MYKCIGWELGLPTERSRATAYRAIRHEITRLVQEAKQLPVLIVDEAQHLRNDVLEDLRLLTNFAMDSEHRLCLVLVGLTELRRRLTTATDAFHVFPAFGGMDRSPSTWGSLWWMILPQGGTIPTFRRRCTNAFSGP